MTTYMCLKQNNAMHLTNEKLEILLHNCMLNQRAAQKEIYCIYYSYVISIALRYSSDYDNAIEMTNDAFLKVYKGLKKFTPRYNNTIASFTAWLKKVVANACVDYVIKYNKKEALTTSINYEQMSLADEHTTAEQMLQHKEIIKCIHQLTPAYKNVFNLYVIEGFSHIEIAYKLNISEGTSKSNLFKARENLKLLLKRYNIISYA
jgi:RNA polymerase sigma factor (sigma-70 family)